MKLRLQELYYWHVQRKTQKFVPWVARKLPAALKYYVVVHGAVTIERETDPSGVTASQMLKLWGKPRGPVNEESKLWVDNVLVWHSQGFGLLHRYRHGESDSWHWTLRRSTIDAQFSKHLQKEA